MFTVSQDSDETVSDELQRAYIAAETLRSALVCNTLHCWNSWHCLYIVISSTWPP